MSQGKAPPVAVFLLVLAASGGLGWLLYETGKGSAETEPPRSGGPSDPAVKRPRTHEPPPAPADETATGPQPVKPPPPGAGPRFRVAGHDDLNYRNWKNVAAAFEGMRDVCRETAEKGRPAPEETERAASMRDRMMAYQTAGFGDLVGVEPLPKTTFADHPAFAANLVASVLEHGKLPLTDAQFHRLGDLAKERSELMDTAEAQIEKDDGRYVLERMSARAQVADGFYGEVYSLLTPAQAEMVSPAGLRGHVQLDLASSATAWARFGRMIAITDLDRFVDFITNAMADQFEVPDRRDEVRKIVDTWARESGFDAADTLERRGFLRASHVAAGTRQTIDLLRRIVDGMKLPPETADKARMSNTAYVPLRM